MLEAMASVAEQLAAPGRVRRGTCLYLCAFDIGAAIDLELCARRIPSASEPERLRLTHHAPRNLQFQPPPLRIVQASEPVRLGAWSGSAQIDVVLYDFGAVSVAYAIEFEGTLEQWIELGCALFESDLLQRGAERRAGLILEAAGDAVQQGGLAAVSEDYAVFELEALSGAEELREVLEGEARGLARLLRSERGELSAEEVADALAIRISFSGKDLAILDWNGAVLFDSEPDDVRAVLEFANVQLLEMRFLDQQLDRSLDRAYEALARRRRAWLPAGATTARALARVSALQVDGAILFERVSNALKLVSDQYLARVYRQASQRFRLAEWNANILRKLDTLDGIYGKMQDRADARRMEFLEWVIIALIAFEVVLGLA